jgi:hypothetical protein
VDSAAEPLVDSEKVDQQPQQDQLSDEAESKDKLKSQKKAFKRGDQDAMGVYTSGMD